MRSGSFFEQNTLKEKAKLLKLPKMMIRFGEIVD